MKFKILNKNAVKIFLTFFILFSFFVHWAGWNEESRLALTRAIVEETRLEIDSYYNNTADRAYYKEHYYSDKAPGTSFLASPLYGIWKFIYYNFFPKDFIQAYSGTNEYLSIEFYNTIIYDQINPGFFILTSMVLVTVFTSSLFGSLLVVLIYKILRYFTDNERVRLFVTISFGLGTLIFPYSANFISSIPTTFFGFFAFYLILKTINERKFDEKILFLAGIFSGFSIVIEYYMIFVFLAYFSIIFNTKSRKNMAYFLFGFFVGLLPLFLYNFSIFLNPFNLTLSYIDEQVTPCKIFVDDVYCQKLYPKFLSVYFLDLTYGFFIFVKILFYPYRGLFFYYPFLFLSLFGLYSLYKKDKFLFGIITFLFISFVLFNSFYPYWYGGTVFGPKYLTPVIPFLSIPMVFSWELFRQKKILYLFLILLISISIFHNFLGFSNNWEEFVLTIKKYTDIVFSFKSLGNPLYQHYLPAFLEHGPRSRILESLISNGNIIDIRDFQLYFGGYTPFLNKFAVLLKTNYGFLTIKLNFFVLFLLIMFVLFIWSREVLDSIKNDKNWIFALIIILSLLVISFRIVKTDILFPDGWYSKEEGNIRAMQEEGLIQIFSDEKIKEAKLVLNVSGFGKDRQIEIFINDNFIEKFFLDEEFKNIYTSVITLNEGKNTIKILSVNGCKFVKEGNRCISIFLKDITILTLDEVESELKIEKLKEPIFELGWYDLYYYNNITYRWLSDKGKFFLYNINHSKDFGKLEFKVNNFMNKNRSLELYLNSNLAEEFTLNFGDNIIETKVLNFKQGENEIKLVSKDGCYIPSKLGLWKDDRCVSFNFKDIIWKEIR